jgi:hypothetical protein
LGYSINVVWYRSLSFKTSLFSRDMEFVDLINMWFNLH